MAVYDIRNGLSNIREVEYKGKRLVVHRNPVIERWLLGKDKFDTYSIENDFNEWIKEDKLIFSNYFQKAIQPNPF